MARMHSKKPLLTCNPVFLRILLIVALLNLATMRYQIIRTTFLLYECRYGWIMCRIGKKHGRLGHIYIEYGSKYVPL